MIDFARSPTSKDHASRKRGSWGYSENFQPFENDVIY